MGKRERMEEERVVHCMDEEEVEDGNHLCRTPGVVFVSSTTVV